MHARWAFRNKWFLLGICCLGLIGFLVAVTIILALIPLYLPTKKMQPNNITASSKSVLVSMVSEVLFTCAYSLGNDTFFLQYDSNGNGSVSLTGTITNLDQLQSRVRLQLFFLFSDMSTH